MARLSNEGIRALLRPHLDELTRRRPLLYVTDLALTTGVAWSSLVLGARLASASDARCALLFPIAVLALYRATSFIHEVSHVRGAMPGWARAWDALVGVPFLVPSLLYGEVHLAHHDARIFGTERDPEYAEHGEITVAGHVARLLALAIAPAFLVVRWGVLGPLSLFGSLSAPLSVRALRALPFAGRCASTPAWMFHPRLRELVVARFSSFSGNPAYRRPAPRGRAARRWLVLELACSAWTLALVALTALGVLSPAALAFAYAVAASASVLHGLRALTTHRFEGGGAARSADEQLLDSLNVTGHWLLTELWAPCGLRYHALHHVAPRLPYHALRRAHRLLLESLPTEHAYRDVTFPGLREVVAHVAGT